MHVHLHMNPLLHAAYHSLLILPLLYIAYVLMELIEHKAGSTFRNALQEDRRTGPIAGATVGLFPLCGFSDLGAGLYSGRVISVGTLVALFVSTSGEILFLMASYPDKILSLLFLLLVKFVIACVCGFILDLILRNKQVDMHIHDLCEENECHCEHSNIWLSAIKHTAPVFCFVLCFNLLIGVLEIFGLVEGITYVVSAAPTLGVIFAALLGLIPGCAPLVLMLGLWNSGILSSAAFLAGLITSAGTGYIVLYKTNKSFKQNWFITMFIFTIGIVFGALFELTGLFSGLGI